LQESVAEMLRFFVLYLLETKEDMNNLIIKRSQIVEAQFTGTPAVGKKYQFLEVPNLSRNNILLYGYEVYSRTQLRATPLGNDVILAADVHNIVLSFRDTNKVEFVYQAPIYSLIRSNVGGFITMITPRLINLTDSYVQITSAANTITTDEVVAVNLYYSLPGE
jgi:hypothetical protein